MGKYKIIISGGGTGGHIFPALAIANELCNRFPDAEILFIGAENRMEMERIPAAGYRILGLPVAGFNRKNMLKNISVAMRLITSLRMARKIIREFKPDFAIGVGGYASGPTLWMASSLHIPILIQEQNSYAGLTNKLLGKRATKICVAYKDMQRYFPADRIVITGNPVRKELETAVEKTGEAFRYFGLETGKPILLVVGGSLGARTINNSINKGLASLIDAGIQVIWQTGKTPPELDSVTIHTPRNGDPRCQTQPLPTGLWVSDFISRMDYAYSIADLVISRAGACTLSELSILKKAAILVPSPNVAENHQTMNARTLSDSQAAILIPDILAEEQLAATAIELLNDKARLSELSVNIATFAQYNSAQRIVDEALYLIGR